MAADGDIDTGPRTPRARCEEAAKRIIHGAALTGRSAFAPELESWTPRAVEELVTGFVERPDDSGDDFMTKLRRQLRDASDEAVVLAAELLYLNMLPLSGATIGVARKRQILGEVLSWARRDVRLPEDYDAALPGFMKGGSAFLTLRWAQFSFLIRLARDLAGRAPSERERLLSDPWAFRRAAQAVLPDEKGGQRARAQYHLLLWLAFPDTFEAIASVEHKERIRAAFADRVDDDGGDLDRDLSAIRASLQAESDTHVWFYDEPWAEVWRSSDEAPTQRGWLVRGANVGGVDLVPQWLEKGFCSLSFHEADEIPPGTAAARMDEILTAAYPDATRASLVQIRSQLDQFLNRMSVGDLVVTLDPDGGVHVGTVASAAYDDPSEGRDRARRRRVQWATPTQHREHLSEKAQGALRSLRTVNEITPVVSEFAEIAGLGDRVSEEVLAVDVTGEIQIPPVTEDFARRLHMPGEWLRETVELLQRKRQIILYGPPGTGKTYLARRIADHVAGPGRTALVQFHPSYSYEDFVAGFRPRQNKDGTMGFDLVPGPLTRVAEAARKAPSQPHVLVVDEINRANLPKVFGELYFLLEYREEQITLQYAREDDTGFSLPENLFVIGTMNTVDRSVALVDAAMRRRFAFQRLTPDLPPVDGLLGSWLRSRGLPEEADRLLRELNRRIGDPDRSVGPSYLMVEGIGGDGVLDRVWRTEILPLLEDQGHGSAREVEAEFGLAALRTGIAASNGQWPGERDGGR